MADPLIGKPLTLPYDIQTEAAKLAQRRKIADLLAAQGMRSTSPVIQVGDTVLPNWGDAISKIANAYFASQMQKSAREDETKLAQETQRQTREGMQKFLTGMYGTPGGEAVGPPEEGKGPPMYAGYAPTRADQIRAIAEAQVSNLQGVRELGTEAYKNMMKGQIGVKELLEYGSKYGNEAMQALAQQQGVQLPAMGLPSRPEVKFEKGMAVTTQDGKVVGAPQPVVSYEAPQPAVGGLPPMQVQKGTGEAHGLSGGNITPPDVKVKTALEEALGAGAVRQLETGKTQAQDALQGLKAVAKARSLVQGLDPTALGTFSNLRLAANKAIEGLGGKALPETASVQELNGALGQVLIGSIRALAPVTKEDVVQMQAILGSTTNTKQALEGMLAYMENKYGTTLSQHQEMVESIMNRPGGDLARAYLVNTKFNVDELGGLNLRAPAEGAGGAPTIDDLLKKYGTR